MLLSNASEGEFLTRLGELSPIARVFSASKSHCLGSQRKTIITRATESLRRTHRHLDSTCSAIIVLAYNMEFNYQEVSKESRAHKCVNLLRAQTIVLLGYTDIHLLDLYSHNEASYLPSKTGILSFF